MTFLCSSPVKATIIPPLDHYNDLLAVHLLLPPVSSNITLAEKTSEHPLKNCTIIRDTPTLLYPSFSLDIDLLM